MRRWLLAAFFGGLFGIVVASAAAADSPPAVVIDQGASHRYFSPNGDTQADDVAVLYCLASPANVTVTVENASGGTVRTLESGVSHPGGAPCYGWNTAAIWDGRGDGGNVVGDGAYTVRIHAVDGSGRTGDDAVEVGVDARTPGAITAPAPGTAVEGTIPWTFTPTGGFQVQTIEVYCTGAAGTGTGLTGTLDTTGCAAGANAVGASVGWTDPFGNPQFWVAPAVPVTVANPPRLSISQEDSHRYFTPDGDGQQDTAIVYYCLSRSGPVTMTVANAAGSLIRTETLTGEGSPECYGWNTTAEWDGRDDGGAPAADGEYTIRLRTADERDRSAEDSVTVGLDRHGPGRITAPAEGATVAGVVDWTFTPAPGHSVDSVEVYCTGAAGSGSGLTGTLDTTQCVGGPNTVTANVLWTDPFGAQQYWTSPPTRVTVDNAPSLAIWQEVSHRYFSPNGDTSDDDAIVYYCLSKPATVTATVTDGAGTTIRTIAGPPFSGAACTGPSNGQLSWDGRTDGGAVAAPGVYTVHLRAVDAAGRTAEDSVSVGLDPRVPGTLTAPAPNTTAEGVLEFAFAPNPGFTLIEVQVRCDGTSYVEVNRPGDDGAFHGFIDTTKCLDGPNTLYATATWRDPFGAFQAWYSPELPITVDNGPRLSINSASHAYFSPNGDTVDDTIAVSYCLSTDATVRASIADAAGTVRRTIETTQTGYPVCYSTFATFITWDGKDDAGTVVPDGVYTVTVKATTAGGRSTEEHVDVGVDNRRVGGVTAPAPGAVLAGIATLAFTPAAGLAVERVDFQLAGAGHGTAFNASPDGVWRTGIATGGLPSGPATLDVSVTYRDAFGARHYWYPGPVPVVVDALAVPLSVVADPATGPAPFATTLRLTASDPGGRTLQYTVQFGDGATASGEITAPYTTVALPHTYTQAGVFRPYVTVTSPSGAAASRTVEVVATGTANTAPAATLTLDRTRGVAPFTVQIAPSATDRENDPLTYAVDFGDGTNDHGSLPHAALAHGYARAGTYVVRLEVSDGRLSTYRTATIVVAPAEPLAAAAGDDMAAVVDGAVHFDAGASRPSLGIESYRWDFGDGASATGAAADHTYTTKGTYTATLTIRAGIQTSVDTVAVTVKEKPAEPGLLVTVTGNGGPQAGARLVVVEPDGTTVTASTGPDGQAHLDALGDGTYTVYGYQAGFLPGTGTGTVTGGSGALTLELNAGQVAETSLTSQPLTKDEIVAAGIDPDDPGNQQVYEFRINLAINDKEVVVDGFASPGGFPLCPQVDGAGATCDRRSTTFRVGDNDVTAAVSYTHDVPQLVWLVIPATASWLKQFFTVQLAVTNLAGEDFSLDDGVATLTLPAGLSLAPTLIPQQATVAVPNVSGGHSATAAWVVRGDRAGDYDSIAATYAATLSPFGAPVTVDARIAKPLKVWGAGAVSIVIDAEQDAYNRYPYRVKVGLTNVADVPIYNAAVALSDAHSPHLLRQPGQVMGYDTAEIKPGETFWTDDYIFAADIEGDLSLQDSFVGSAAGAHGPRGVIRQHPAASDPDHGPDLETFGLGTGVGLKWTAIAGATGYEVYQTPDLATEFPAVPVAELPAGATKAFVPLAKGGSGWFAISAIVDGKRVMFHPIQQAQTSELPTAPVVEAKVSSTASCNQDITVTVHATDEFFNLTSYTATLDGVPTPVGGGPLTGHAADATFTIPVVDLTAAGSRLRITATDDAPGTGPEFSTTVGSGCDPIRMLVVGDSIAWGQGLAPKHKYPELVKDALQRSSGRPVEYTEAKMSTAHSGAAVTGGTCSAGLRQTVGYWGGEVPNGEPDIATCQAQSVRDREADLILVDGCINDVDIREIAKPFADLDALRARVEAKCGQPVENLLRTLHNDHPTATIVLTGYYPIFDREPDHDQRLTLADLLGLPRQAFVAMANATFGQQSAVFDTGFRNLALQHVATLDPQHTWLHFADPGFRPGDGLFQPNSKLFNGLNDEVRLERFGACVAAGGLRPHCPIASMGHPNVAGAQLYADAILGNISGSAPHVTGLSAAPVTLAKGETRQLYVTANYSDGSTRDATRLVTASVKNPAIATIDPATLKVTGAARGSTTVTVTLTSDPALKATATVTVNPAAATGLSLTPAAPTVLNGKTVRLTAVLSLTDGTTKTATAAKVTWTTNDPALATVTELGVVKGVGAGAVTVTASYKEDDTATPIVASTLVTVAATAPTITEFTPYGGYEGQVVTVTGTDFQGATSVTLGGVEMTNFTVVSSTTITFVAQPDAKTGYITVTTPLGTARSRTKFSFVW
ncbi:PKD domain-containing protein [Dactylosporangium sp. CA-233914]|uniref:PKD domain-containing protein n=1 Tax=Dactylosporangium sp. CA-233914 TaxID=3239934 RepID=UPI003D8FA0FA